MATVNGVFALPLDPIDLPGSVMLCCTYQALTNGNVCMRVWFPSILRSVITLILFGGEREAPHAS